MPRKKNWRKSLAGKRRARERLLTQKSFKEVKVKLVKDDTSYNNAILDVLGSNIKEGDEVASVASDDIKAIRDDITKASHDNASSTTAFDKNKSTSDDKTKTTSDDRNLTTSHDPKKSRRNERNITKSIDVNKSTSDDRNNTSSDDLKDTHSDALFVKQVEQSDDDDDDSDDNLTLAEIKMPRKKNWRKGLAAKRRASERLQIQKSFKEVKVKLVKDDTSYNNAILDVLGSNIKEGDEVASVASDDIKAIRDDITKASHDNASSTTADDKNKSTSDDKTKTTSDDRNLTTSHDPKKSRRNERNITKSIDVNKSTSDDRNNTSSDDLKDTHSDSLFVKQVEQSDDDDDSDDNWTLAEIKMPRKKNWRKGLAAKRRASERLQIQKSFKEVKVKLVKDDTSHDNAILDVLGSNIKEGDEVASVACDDIKAIRDDITKASHDNASSTTADDKNKSKSDDKSKTTSDDRNLTTIHDPKKSRRNERNNTKSIDVNKSTSDDRNNTSIDDLKDTHSDALCVKQVEQSDDDDDSDDNWTLAEIKMPRKKNWRKGLAAKRRASERLQIQKSFKKVKVELVKVDTSYDNTILDVLGSNNKEGDEVASVASDDIKTIRDDITKASLDNASSTTADDENKSTSDDKTKTTSDDRNLTTIHDPKKSRRNERNNTKSIDVNKSTSDDRNNTSSDDLKDTHSDFLFVKQVEQSDDDDDSDDNWTLAEIKMLRKKNWRKGLAAKRRASERLQIQKSLKKVKVELVKVDTSYDNAILGVLGSNNKEGEEVASVANDDIKAIRDDITKASHDNASSTTADDKNKSKSDDKSKTTSDDRNLTTIHDPKKSRRNERNITKSIDVNKSTSDDRNNTSSDDLKDTHSDSLFVKQVELGDDDDDSDDNWTLAEIKAVNFRSLNPDLFTSLIKDQLFVRKLLHEFEEKDRWKRFQLLDLLQCATNSMRTYGEITRWNWAHMLNGVTKLRHRKFNLREVRKKTLEVLKWIVKRHRDLVIEWKDGIEPDLEALPEPILELSVWSDEEVAMEMEEDCEDSAEEEFVIVKAEQDDPLNCSGGSGSETNVVEEEALVSEKSLKTEEIDDKSAMREPDRPIECSEEGRLDGNAGDVELPYCLHNIKTEDEEVYDTENPVDASPVVPMTTEMDGESEVGESTRERFFLNGNEVYIFGPTTGKTTPPESTTDNFKASVPHNGASLLSYKDLTDNERAVLETEVCRMPTAEAGRKKTGVWNRIAAMVNQAGPGRQWTAQQLFTIWSRKLFMKHVASKNVVKVVNGSASRTILKSLISKEKSGAKTMTQFSIQPRNSYATSDHPVQSPAGNPGSLQFFAATSLEGELTPEESRVLHEQYDKCIDKLNSGSLYFPRKIWSDIAQKVNEVETSSHWEVRELRKIMMKDLKQQNQHCTVEPSTCSQQNGQITSVLESAIISEQPPLKIGQKYNDIDMDQEIMPSTSFQPLQDCGGRSLTNNPLTPLVSRHPHMDSDMGKNSLPLQQTIGKPPIHMETGMGTSSTCPLSQTIPPLPPESASKELVLYELTERENMVKLSVTVPKECMRLRLLDKSYPETAEVKEEPVDDTVFTADQYKVLTKLIQHKINIIKLTGPSVVSLVLNATDWENLGRLVNKANSSNLHSVPNIKDKVHTMIKSLDNRLSQRNKKPRNGERSHKRSIAEEPETQAKRIREKPNNSLPVSRFAKGDKVKVKHENCWVEGTIVDMDKLGYCAQMKLHGRARRNKWFPLTKDFIKST